MKAKPWERNRQVDHSLSAQIQQNNQILATTTPDQLSSQTLIPNSGADSPTGGSVIDGTAGLGGTSTLGNGGLSATGLGGINSGGLGGMGSSYGGMGSSYGGMGSSYGGMGSSYGGMGGYGSSMYGGGYGSSMYGGGMYGGGMYGGGMYGGGMYGRMMDPNNPGMLQNSMMYLNSFGIVLQSLGEIARTLEMNAQGLVHLWVSTFNLVLRVKGWGVSFITFIKTTAKKIRDKIIHFLEQKGQFLFGTGKDNKNMKLHLKIVQVAIKIALVLFLISFIPILKKMMKHDAHEAVFKKLAHASAS